MKRVMVLFYFLLIISAGVAQDIPADIQKTLVTASEAFMDAISSGRYEDATAAFDKTMKEVSGADKLDQLWHQLQQANGSFKYRQNIRLEAAGIYHFSFITCVFEKEILDIKLVFDAQQKIAGMWIVPSWTAPDYADRNTFGESEVTFGVEGWKLPGTLSVPKGTGPFPAVVLVHGSGPNDRNEMIGPNRPFEDIAWGLASQGIAVLRYDKRTKVYSNKLMNSKEPFTVFQETVQDALEAAAFLRKNGNVDPKRIFVLGHSLGGMLAPRIGAADTSISGLIIMAGSLRPLEDITEDQLDYLLSLKKDAPAAEVQQLEMMKKGLQKVREITPESKGLFMGAPPSYWLDLKSYDLAAAAQHLTMPMLILQGERDYQILLTKDFVLWKKTLDDKPGVTYKTYPKLNHLFIEGEGPGLSKPDDYSQPGHVATGVVEDIAGWIKAH